jgi:hypothetical protein
MAELLIRLRPEDLREIKDYVDGRVADALAHVAALEAENTRLREALRFYATSLVEETHVAREALAGAPDEEVRDA